MTTRKTISLILLTAALLGLAVGAAAAVKDRSEIPDQYKWNLTDLYASRDAWKAKKAEVAGRLPELAAFNGKLGDSAASLLKGLSTEMDIRKEVVRLYVYAMQMRDEDTRVAENVALFQEAEQLMNAYKAATAFIQPEILAIDPAKVEAFFTAEPGLKPYRPYIDNILRLKAHTRSPEVEKVLAQAGNMQATPDNVYGTFTGADFPYPEITLSTGEKVTLDPSGFAKVRSSTVKEDRYAAFKAFFSAYAAYEGTIGSLMYGQVTAAHVHQGRAGVQDLRGGGPRRERRPRGRLREPHPEHPREPAHPAPLPQAAPEDDGGRQAPLRGPLHAHREERGDELHARAGHGHDPEGLRPSGPRLRGHPEEGLREPVGGLVPHPRQAERRLQRGGGLRRAPLPAPQLQRPLHGRLDPGPRVGPLHALLPVQPQPALRHQRARHLRGGGGLHPQRVPPLPRHAGECQGRRHPALPPQLPPGQLPADPLPPDPLRRVRAQGPPDGRARRIHHGRPPSPRCTWIC